MDANRQRFWMLANEDDWSGAATERDHVEYDPVCRRLRLRDHRPARSVLGVLNTPDTEALLGLPAHAIDAYGTTAFWDPAANAVRATGGLGPGGEPVTLWNAPPNHRAADLALGYDDVLYLAVQEDDGGGVLVRSFVGMFDPRGRWRHPPVFEVLLETFTADRLAADPAGGVWVLDRGNRAIGRVRGLPLRDGLPPPFSETTFRPRPEHPDAPHFTVDLQQPAWVPGEQPVNLACSPEGRLALITWRTNNETWFHLRETSGQWQAARRMVDPGEHPGLPPERRARPATLAWLSEQRLVVLPGPRTGTGSAAQAREAIPYDPDDPTDTMHPGGGFYPVRGLASALFLKGMTRPPHYPLAGEDVRSAPLHPLSVVSFERTGTAAGRLLDGHRDQTVWHRLYLEATFPPGCRAEVMLAATNDPDAERAQLDWHAHPFGDVQAMEEAAQPDAPRPAVARGVWLKDRSEIPHHAGLLGRDPEPNRAGLFTALIQRPGRAVRRLTGRYLHVDVRLHGTGHLTPEIAAVRVYASRFSYRDEYLPEVYHETCFGQDADRQESATGADFLERFLSLFESVLTPLEDRAVFAQAVMAPHTTPAEALDWLGGWIGVVFDESFPEDRRRSWIEAAPWLFQTRGTLVGLQLALEIATGGRLQRRFVDRAERVLHGRSVPLNADAPDATDLCESVFPEGGGVTGGEIIVLEDYRLRRTFATLLGVNLSEEHDPLLPGLIVSANSRVGDTLFIGQAEKEELLALFRDAFSDDPAQRTRELRSVRAFYEQLAFRATVFVHDSVTPADVGLLQRIVAREAPAHVETRVVRATYPLLVGLASLVDIDTYLGPSRQRGVVHLNRSRIGENDFVRGTPALDPRLGGGMGTSAPPEARISGLDRVLRGQPITLDASPSNAAPGRVLERYIWTLRP